MRQVDGCGSSEGVNGREGGERGWVGVVKSCVRSEREKGER